MFHSLYGTFDYRFGAYDLRHGRTELQSLIGLGAEELVFAICTSDRIGLISDLIGAMYGPENMSKYGVISKHVVVDKEDGNPFPPLIGRLSDEGFPVRNHITQKVHIIPADCFAQFVIVMIADFMDQGVVGTGSSDMDLCLFQFLRYRFYNDLLIFVSKHIRYIPPVWKKYMWDKKFHEPKRDEIQQFKIIWNKIFDNNQIFIDSIVLSEKCEYNNVMIDMNEKQFLVSMITKYPYVLEPMILLGLILHKDKHKEFEVINHILV